MTELYSDDAELYDIAFDWDVSDEVDWLCEWLGRPQTVLEPGCGSGRMLEAFTRRGVEVAGIDASPKMIELARERLGKDADLRLADNGLRSRPAIDPSPFAETARYDGGRTGEWPLAGRDATGGLLWHELRR